MHLKQSFCYGKWLRFLLSYLFFSYMSSRPSVGLGLRTLRSRVVCSRHWASQVPLSFYFEKIFQEWNKDWIKIFVSILNNVEPIYRKECGKLSVLSLLLCPYHPCIMDRGPVPSQKFSVVFHDLYSHLPGCSSSGSSS